MKTQLSRPTRRKASYTDQYKQEALKLWRNSGAPFCLVIRKLFVA